MSKKIIFGICLLFSFFLFNSNNANAIVTLAQNNEEVKIEVQKDDIDSVEEAAIRRVSLRDKLQREPETQIRSFYKKFNKYSESNNLSKLKEMYSDIYVNNDGHDKATVFKMMEEASSAYKNIKYNTELKNIEVNGMYAVIDAVETADGETVKEFPQVPGTGSISSKIQYTDYLRKENGKWKIIATEVFQEDVALKYGRAKIMTTEVSGPDCIPAGSEYEIGVKISSASEDLIVGSITNEKIKYPQEQPKDVLRAIKYDELTRILKANTDNYNEYATISLAISTANVEPDAVVINMQGIAILMHRVNVLNQKKIEVEVAKD